MSNLNSLCESKIYLVGFPNDNSYINCYIAQILNTAAEHQKRLRNILRTQGVQMANN